MVISSIMKKPVLKVSVSNSDSSSEDESGTECKSLSDQEDEGELNNEQIDSNVTNVGWADSLSKILGTTKPKNKKTLVLSRAKKYSETVKESVKKEEFEVEGHNKVVNETTNKQEEPVTKKKKVEKLGKVRVKPNILERDREKLLAKIATKGVVQLFNAVRNQQRSLEQQIGGNDVTETRKDKIKKSFDKRSFLDTLMGETKSVVVDQEKTRNELKNENKSKWGALSDDYMLGAKMKDWDKEVED